jgi:hypothetical protein
LATSLPHVVETFNRNSLLLEFAEILDAIKLIFVLPLLVWALRQFPLTKLGADRDGSRAEF